MSSFEASAFGRSVSSRLRNHLESYGWILVLSLGLLYRLCLAQSLPITNDEAYYWDWGQELHGSYFDHPPGVSWLTAAASSLTSGLLGVRLLVPFLHFLASLFLLQACLRLARPSPAVASRILIGGALGLQLIPGLSLWGVFALPDAGLYFALSLALWAVARMYERPQLQLSDALVFGLSLGIAGLFKYHALPVGGGLALGLLWVRRRSLPRDWGFWAFTIVIGALVCLPVWIWNWQHDFASFRFQTEHGFGSAQWRLDLGLRSLAMTLVFLGPVAFALSLQTVYRLLCSSQHRWRWLILGSAAPLLLIISIMSFGKPMLIHWLMPSFWMLLPAGLLLLPPLSQRLSRGLVAYGLILGGFLPALLAHEGLRNRLLRAQAGQAGALSEITVWSPLSRELERQLAQWPQVQQAASCPPEGYRAGWRWYAAAQLRFHSSHKDPVLNLDPDHRSYYHYRDLQIPWEGCQVALVIPEAVWRTSPLRIGADWQEIRRLTIQDHEKEPFILALGRLPERRPFEQALSGRL